MEPATKDYRRTTLKRRHRPVARALAEALVAPDGEMDAERLEAFVDELDRFISVTSKTLRFGLMLMLDVIRWSPILSWKLRAFEELSIDERIHHLERLESSKVAQFPLLVVSYKTMMTMLFYDDPKELAAIGYSEKRTRHRPLPVAPIEEARP